MPDDRPLLNPVLRLNMEAKPEASAGGGKSADSIVVERLRQQQRTLSGAADAIYQRRTAISTFAGRIHLLVKMFAEDSLAPSYTPKDLFSKMAGCQLVAPMKAGYLVESTASQLPLLASSIRNPTSVAVRCDISRVKSVHELTLNDRLGQRNAQSLWNASQPDDDGRGFIIWLAPFQDAPAQEALMKEIERLARARAFLPTSGEDMSARGRALAIPQNSSIARALRTYRNTGIGRAVVRIPNQEALNTLLASGISHRIDPVRPITVAAPGEGREPTPPFDLRNAPIVGVIDGGLHAQSYKSAEEWRAPPLINDTSADRAHGNAISSLVVQGHAWNKNRDLPALDCKIGSVQAVPRAGAVQQFNERDLIDYLAGVVRAHPETKIWNISANQDEGDEEQISYLGMELSALSRAANILPVISVGNRKNGILGCPAPPADCEAGIVVGGRLSNKDGKPDAACTSCLAGPGPEGMLKPDLSWFSELRVIGGKAEKGSSFPTALVSSLAAHTFANLKEPTPDLVKALLINATERYDHDAALGWGSPFQGHLPWVCAPGTVTLAWRAMLEPGPNYYWNDIPIPAELIRDGKLKGRATLTAILRPLTSPFGGANYFASRLQTSLRYKHNGDWKPLLGSMAESTLEEQDARTELKKWQPIRRHCKDFSRGRKFSGNHFQLYARVYTRDLYQFGMRHHSQAGEQEVAFVLTLEDLDKRPSIYDNTVRALGNFVESAVLNQNIEIRNRR
jgi:hypothetical protein